MNFTISSKELQSKLSIVSKVILKKNMLRILDYAMVSLSDNKFFLTGASTDNQVTIALDLLMTSKGEFKPFCIDVSQFLAILGTLPEQPIELLVDENKNYSTVVRYDGGVFELASLPAAEFPVKATLSDEETKVAFNIPASVLLPCTKAAQLCAGDEELYPAMMAVALDVSVEGVTFVSTDRNKLYCYSYSHGVPFLTHGSPATILFHRTMMSALDGVVGKAETVAVRASDKCIEVSAGDAVLLAAGVNGKFPDYTRVIPKESRYHVKVGVSDLALAIKRASIMADTSTGLLILTKKTDGLTVHSYDINYGKSSTTRVASLDCNIPDDFRIGLKASNLLGLLGNISTSNVILQLSDPSRPVVIREDADNSALVELIMPMNIANA